ncbi:MmgE/PrpD family protein [Lactobacillaceae bacterium L1_55_11]|nr:MmgE/PrpD family protein [Lactobacillaceae bacterium L1_55_11]
MTEQKSSANLTERLASLIVNSKVQPESAAYQTAQKCLLDYLASFYAAKDKPAVGRLYQQLAGLDQVQVLPGNASVEPGRVALLNGFAAHYCDLDDVQANFRGHPSAVIYSALLAVSEGSEPTERFFQAYVVGVEVAGQLGAQVNPKHKLDGYHTTATLGTIAAAAALAYYERFSLSETVAILSFAATQAAGLGLESGTDTKPLHAGLAAQRAVQSYQFVTSGLTSSQDAFNNKNGWVKTVAGVELDEQQLVDSWLRPAQIVQPGIWFKQHQFCSAAMSGYDAVRQAYQAGIRLDQVERVIFHFPPDADKVLRYRRPENGQAGKFSIEYIAWQVLSQGDVNDALFDPGVETTAFQAVAGIFSRVNDLPAAGNDQRETVVELVLKGQQVKRFDVKWPKGSPQNPLNFGEIEAKLAAVLAPEPEAIVQQLVVDLNQSTLNNLLATLAGIRNPSLEESR